MLVYLMKETVQLREKLQESEETASYWFRECQELRKRYEKQQSRL